MSEIPAPPTQPHSRFPVWPGIFILVAVQGAAGACALASLPADAGGRFLGFSAARLLLMALLLGGALGFALLAWHSRRDGAVAWWAGLASRLPIKNALFVLLPLVALACVLAPLTLLSLYHTGGTFLYFAYFQRLLPLFAWLLLASLEIFGGLAWSGSFHWNNLGEQRRVFRAGLLGWTVFGLLWLFVALTGVGITRDLIGWGQPTVSLMEWQIWLAWAAGIALLLWMAYRGWNARRDWLLACAIGLLAAGVWLSQPIQPAFFATAGRPPNFEIYPFSDGAYYDHFAQSLLIGEGFKGGEIPARPIYITLLAGFHLLGGQKYENVIAVQTLLLAFFPVILFLLGKALHSRPVGLFVALLAILREYTAITAMPFTDNASNSKLYFADLPAALAVSLWALLVVLWLKAGARRPLLPLAVGGGLGAAMLFRTQSMFMLPAVLLLALFIYRFRWERWLRAAALVGLGLALTLAPWLWRNWTVTGRLAFDDDKSQTGAMAQRYSLSGYDDSFSSRPGEDARAYSTRVTQGIFRFLLAHPDVVAGFVSAHWINAEIANVLVLPVRSGVADLRELIMPLRATWQDWNGALSPWQAVLFATNLGLVALGVGACWVRLGWQGIVLLLINLSYNFSNALARNSGGRYLLVVDWVMLIYAAVGLMEIAIAVLVVLRVSPQRISALLAKQPTPEEAPISAVRLGKKARLWPAGAAIALVFLLFGSLPVLAERLIPARYPPQTRAALVEEALQSANRAQSGLEQAALATFLTEPGVTLVKGRALYPRYYKAGHGEPFTAKTGYEPLDYARTVFLITGNTHNGIAILKARSAPGYFPNASDVIVAGCLTGTYLDARLVLVLDSQGGVYTSDLALPVRCPAVQNPE